MSLASEYSGVVINQNATPTGKLSPINTHYQNFKLPTNYRLGSEPGQHQYPALSGFQLLVEIYPNSALKAEIKYVLQYHVFGAGWKTLTEGTTLGCHAEGEKVWMDVFFEEPVAITPEIAEAEFRIGFKPNTWVHRCWYVEPALPAQPAYYFLAKEELLSLTFNYRILALTADSGTDFLGNPYRSIAIQKELESTSTINPNKGLWRSSPQPSKFAVVSNYFDVRFDPGGRYGLINYVPDPSFEYDKVGGSAFEWEEYIGEGGAEGKVEVSSAWASSGSRSLFLKSASLTNSGIPAISGGMWGVKTVIPYKGTGATLDKFLKLNVKKLPAGGKIGVNLIYENSSHESLGGEGGGAGITTTGEHTIENETEPAPAKAKEVAFIKIQVYCYGANGQYEWYLDSVCIKRVEPDKVGPSLEYFDGDSPNCIWLGAPGASASVELLPSTPEEAVVIDGIMLDPQTPNVAFNVYYSSEGEVDENTTTEEWDQKLWTRVPRTYIATQRQNYVFPSPITAKYIKVEYSHLQAQAYNPGDFQQPVTYKKFPKWVTAFFLGQLTAPTFIASQVGVAYDALQFAYEYYLDDLHQIPAQPLAPTVENEEKLKRFFSQSDATNLVDQQTLEKINLIPNTYTEPPAAQAHDSLLGTQAKRVASLQTNYPVEQEPEQENKNLLAVSSLNRENVVIEESTPVMYFYLTCRHAYKELTTSFEYNRAYFVGINEIAFIRNSYSTTADSEVYIELGGDTENLVTNDFVIHDDGSWSTF